MSGTWPEQVPSDVFEDTFSQDLLHGLARAASLLQPGFGSAPSENPVGEELQFVCDDVFYNFSFEAICDEEGEGVLNRRFSLSEQTGFFLPAVQVVERFVGMPGKGVGNRRRRQAFRRASAFQHLVRREFAVSDDQPYADWQQYHQVVDERDFVYHHCDLLDEEKVRPEEASLSQEERDLLDEIAYQHTLDRANAILYALGLPACDFRDQAVS